MGGVVVASPTCSTYIPTRSSHTYPQHLQIYPQHLHTYPQACCFKQAAEMAAAAELHCERCIPQQSVEPSLARCAQPSSAAGSSATSRVQERAEQLFDAMRSEAIALKMVHANGFPSYAETDASKDLQVEAGKGRGEQYAHMSPVPILILQSCNDVGLRRPQPLQILICPQYSPAVTQLRASA